MGQMCLEGFSHQESISPMLRSSQNSTLSLTRHLAFPERKKIHRKQILLEFISTAVSTRRLEIHEAELSILQLGSISLQPNMMPVTEQVGRKWREGDEEVYTC